MNAQAVLSVNDLRVWYGTEGDPVRAVDGVSLEIRPARRWVWWASRAAASRPWGEASSACCPRSAAPQGRLARPIRPPAQRLTERISSEKLAIDTRAGSPSDFHTKPEGH